jgi:hypothetical protein
MKIDKIKIYHVKTGRQRDIAVSLWNKFPINRTDDTREGWKEVANITDDEKIEAIKRFDEMIKQKTQPVEQPAQQPKPEKKNAVDVEIESGVDEFTGNPEVMELIGEAEQLPAQSQEEKVDPVVKKRSNNRKKK